MLETIKRYKILIGVIAFLQASAIPFVIWAADTVFQTDKEALSSEIRQLIRMQKDFQVQLGYAESDRKKEELMSRIKLIQLEIDELRSEE